MANGNLNLSFSIRDVIYIFALVVGMVVTYFINRTQSREDIRELQNDVKTIKEVLLPDIRNDFGKDIEHIKEATDEIKKLLERHAEGKVNFERMALWPNSFLLDTSEMDTLTMTTRGNVKPKTYLYNKNVIYELKQYSTYEIKQNVVQILANLNCIKGILRREYEGQYSPVFHYVDRKPEKAGSLAYVL